MAQRSHGLVTSPLPARREPRTRRQGADRPRWSRRWRARPGRSGHRVHRPGCEGDTPALLLESSWSGRARGSSASSAVVWSSARRPVRPLSASSLHKAQDNHVDRSAWLWRRRERAWRHRRAL